MIKEAKRLLLLFLAMGLLALPIWALAAESSEIETPTLSSSFTGSGSGSVSNGEGIMTVNGSKFSDKTGTLTLTNDGSETAQLSFTYTAAGTYSSFTVAGVAANASGSYSAELEAGKSITIVMTVPQSGLWASAKSASVSLTNVKLEVINTSDITLTHNGLGTISVDNTPVEPGTTISVDAGGSQLTATASTGAVFVGWINTTDNSVVSPNANFKYVPTGNATLKAIFANADTEASYWGSNKAYLFEHLTEAISHASSSTNKTIILAGNGTLPAGNHTIPDGVTLLIPFDDNGTCYTTQPGYDEGVAWSKPSAHLTLTMKKDANITVAEGGHISVSAKVATTQGYCGAPTSKYGHIDMCSGSSITVENGGKLYVWGYITGTGNVAIKSGGTVYESFQVVDWRGGTASTSMIGMPPIQIPNDEKVFPMSQYFVQNVEVPMVLECGATENCSLVADIMTVYSLTVKFLGTEGCMFNLTEGSITKQYDGSTDRLVLSIDGALSISKTEVVMIKNLYTIDFDDYVIPINGNVTINVENGGTLSVNATASLLPGAQINIAERGKMVLGSGVQLFVYDETEWKAEKYVYSNAHFRSVQYAPGQSYTRTEEKDIIDARILVNGELDASAGHLITTATGGNICSTGSGIVTTNGTLGNKPTGDYYLYEAVQTGSDISYSGIPVAAAWLKNANGTYVHSQADTYKYCLATGRWECSTHTRTDGACECSVCGAHNYDKNNDYVCSCVFEFYATNVNLGNNLDMLFAFPVEGNEAAEYAVFTRAGHDAVIVPIDKEQTVKIGNVVCYYVSYSGFAAKEMCDTVYVHLYDSDDNRISECKNDGIQAYAKRVWDKTEGAEDEATRKLRIVIVDLLNYGAACQKHFVYNTGNLANAGFPASGTDYSMPESASAISNKYFIGTNLITTSNIQFALKPSAAFTAEMKATYSFTNHWNKQVEGELAYNAEEDYYYIDALVVADAASEITITVNGDTANVYKDSIKAYCERMYNKTADSNIKNTFLTFMKFATSAKDYLHSKYDQEG